MSALSAVSPAASFQSGRYLDELFGGAVSRPDTFKQEQNRQLGERIRARRRSLGLSAHDLAIHVDVRDVTVAKWERGENRPRPVYHAGLAEALKMGVDDLFLGKSMEEQVSEMRGELRQVTDEMARVREILEQIAQYTLLERSSGEGQR